MRDAMLLVHALRNPASTLALSNMQWTQLFSMARAESLMGTLALRLADVGVPDAVLPILRDAREAADLAKRQALWEADCAARALASYDGKVVLLKGTAYVAAELEAGQGRSIGDLDIMVARADLPEVEELLLAAGWEWVKPDAYDDAYYRNHMHELPPLIHRERDRMIDVHHTILPLTARPTPDALAMLANAISVDVATSVRAEPVEGRLATSSPKVGKLFILSPTDMTLHCVAHMFADGDLAGGLRNLWDLDRLTREFADADEDFWMELDLRAGVHGLEKHLTRSLRIAHRLYGTPIPQDHLDQTRLSDDLFVRRLLARDGWGRETCKFTRLIFYVRSHLLRMPPMMLARHLWTKWRKQKGK